MRVNSKKRRYIRYRFIIEMILFLTGATRQSCITLGYGAACLPYYDKKDINEFLTIWSREKISTFSDMIRWSLIVVAYERLFIFMAGLILLPFVIVSIVLRLF